MKKKMLKPGGKNGRQRRKKTGRPITTPSGGNGLRTATMPFGLSRTRYNASLNPQFNPSINPKVNASINPKFNPWIHPERNTRIHPKFNRSLNPLFTLPLNPTYNPSLDPKQTLKFSGLCRLSPDAELIGYIVRTSNKDVLLLFDKDLNWTAYAVDNSRQGYNLFDLEGNWIGYALKNQAGGWNEFNLEGDWIGFFTGR